MKWSRQVWMLAALVFLMAFAGVGTALWTPGGIRLPIHWRLDGTPDTYTGKWSALGFIPVLALFTILLWIAIMAGTRSQASPNVSDRFATVALIVCTGLTFIQLGLCLIALGYMVPMTWLGIAASVAMLSGIFICLLRTNR